MCVPMQMVSLTSRQLLGWLFALTAAIALLGLASELIDYLVAPSWAATVVPMLSLSYEHNLPTWYAVCLHAQIAILCALTAGHQRQQGGRHARRWRLLSAAFAYISLDELVELHEAAGGWFETGGLLYFDWVIPGAAITLALGLWFLPLVRDLPAPTRGRVITAGCVFVGGALLMELPLGYWTDLYGADNLGYALIDWVEESLELLGLALFVRALIGLATGGSERFRFGFNPYDDDPATSDQ